MQTSKVVLHQTRNFDNDDDVKDMVGEDWIDISILKSTATLDIGAMDSGVIFGHDNNDASIWLVNMRVYMKNNTPDSVRYSNGTTTVNGFVAVRNLIGTPMEQKEALNPQLGKQPLPRALALWVHWSSFHWQVPMLWEQMQNEPSAVPAPSHTGWDEQQKQ